VGYFGFRRARATLNETGDELMSITKFVVTMIKGGISVTEAITVGVMFAKLKYWDGVDIAIEDEKL
jgi:hypothetical protein